MDYQPIANGPMLFRCNCPDCGAFYQGFTFTEQCDCGHKFLRTERDRQKEEFNRQFEIVECDA